MFKHLHCYDIFPAHTHTHPCLYCSCCYEMCACLIVVPSSHKMHKINPLVSLVQMMLVVVVVGDKLFHLMSRCSVAIYEWPWAFVVIEMLTRDMIIWLFICGGRMVEVGNEID